jgi:hypothetical protein
MKKVTKKQQLKIKKVAQKRADYTKARSIKNKLKRADKPEQPSLEQ